MHWDLINTQPVIPKCIFCDRTSDQMARFMDNTSRYIHICSDCGRFVKDCLNQWKDLKSTDYINSDFKSGYIDPL